MLNKTKHAGKVSFNDTLLQLSLEQLTALGSELIDTILRHYDELDDLFNAVLEDKQENQNENISLNKYECSISILNNSIKSDTFKLSQVRNHINKYFQLTLLSVIELQENNITCNHGFEMNKPDTLFNKAGGCNVCGRLENIHFSTCPKNK